MQHQRNTSSKHTSIMHDTADDNFLPAVKLLFTDYGISTTEYDSRDSRHDFWQMEIIIEGTVFVKTEDSQKLLTQGKMIIIPPGTRHKFSYRAPRKTWSLKFNFSSKTVENIPITVLPDSSPGTQKVCGIFLQLLSGYKQIPPALYATVEYLIGGLLVMCYQELRAKETIPKWALAAKEFITVNINRNINIEDLAEHLQYTRVHLARLCRKDMNMKLKEFFDREKVEIIRKKLVYSSKSITEIAQDTGFNDVYSFSRFYKRVTSMTPSAQRALSQE